jgi:hypothetical protein
VHFELSGPSAGGVPIQALLDARDGRHYFLEVQRADGPHSKRYQSQQACIFTARETLTGAPRPEFRLATAINGLRSDFEALTSTRRLVRSLLGAELVDELVLMIEPITLGGGKTLFPNDGKMRRFELTSAKTAATGVQVCRYQPTH